MLLFRRGARATDGIAWTILAAIELYADGTWHSDDVRPNASLEEYLGWIEQTQSCFARLA